jgi:hypothetical protein
VHVACVERGDIAEIAEKDSANGKNNVFCYFATNRLRNSQVKIPTTEKMQQIESPLQNTKEGMAKACVTKAPERDRCRLRLQPDEMALYLPHD